jgi:hypothetical protein
MVDPDLIDENTLAQQGLAFLHESGVLQMQRARLLERLASGDANEDDEELIKRIKEYRIQSGFVETLLELGEKYVSKEKNDEPR